MIPVGDLHVGSVVRLISGSPKMTVAAIRGAAGPPGHRVTVTPSVDVVWCSERLGLQRASLSPDLLTWPRYPAPEQETEDRE